MRELTLVALLASTLRIACLADQSSLVAGQYIEHRSNRVYGCPCEFSSEWADSGRNAVLAWNVQSGGYAGESLRGVRMAAVIVADYSVGVAATGARSTIFIDRSASPEQRRAGFAWLRAHYGELLGRVLAEHSSEIDFQLDSESANLRIPGTLTVRMRRADPARELESWAFLLFDPLTKLVSSNFGMILEAEYRSVDLRIRWVQHTPAVSGYFGTFAMEPLPR
jgi:hypothetical protein